MKTKSNRTRLACLTRTFLALSILICCVCGCFSTAGASALTDEMPDWTDLQHTVHEIATMAREAGFPEDSPIIQECIRVWWEEEAAHIDEPDSEYPVAQYVWDYLHDYGYSDAVTAGIIGNMMSECGGQTLALQPYVYGGGRSYYGLCQWSRLYYPQAMDLDVDGQMQVLIDTIDETMRVRGGSYAYFLTITNAYDAAYYFEKYYEGAGWATIRGTNALTAFEYFT